MSPESQLALHSAKDSLRKMLDARQTIDNASLLSVLPTITPCTAKLGVHGTLLLGLAMPG